MSNNLDSSEINTSSESPSALGIIFGILGGLCGIGLLVVGAIGGICALNALRNPSLQGTMLNIIRFVGALAALKFLLHLISGYYGGSIGKGIGFASLMRNINKSEIEDSKEEYQSDFHELRDYIEDAVAGIDETIQYDNSEDVFQELDEWAEALEVTGEEISKLNNFFTFFS